MDENVPESVAQFFRDRGHQVVHVRDVLPRGTADSIVAVAGDVMQAILVTWDKDYRALLKRAAEVGQKSRFQRLSRISFNCPEPMGRQRLEQLMPSIEFEWQQCQLSSDRRLLILISQQSFRVER